MFCNSSEESGSELEDEVYKLPSPRNTGIGSISGSLGKREKKHSKLPKMAQQDPRRLNTKFNATQVPKKKQGKIESVVYVQKDKLNFTLEDESGLYIFTTKEREEGDTSTS